MKAIIAMLALVMLSQAQAQTAQTNPQDAAIVVQSAPQPMQQQVAAPSQQQAQSASPIYILNNQKQDASQGTSQATNQTQVSQQPVSVIQDTPLVQSAADGIRKRRQAVEAGTEDNIVQALERARMDDEMRRREKFNNAIVAPEPQVTVMQSQQQVQSVQVTPAVSTAAAPAQVTEIKAVQVQAASIEVNKVETEKVGVNNEIHADIDKDLKKNVAPFGDTYISGLVGYSKYPDVINVRGNVSAGVALGFTTADRFVAEGSFVYGSYELEDLDPAQGGGNPYYPRIVDMKQFNWMGAGKYQILPGFVRPTVGALASYTHRTYSELDFNFQSSDAFDVGLSAGCDFVVSRNFMIGVDFRYMTNVTNHTNTEYRQSFVYPTFTNDVEKLDYYTTFATAKLAF